MLKATEISKLSRLNSVLANLLKASRARSVPRVDRHPKPPGRRNSKNFITLVSPFLSNRMLYVIIANELAAKYKSNVRR